MNKKRGRMYQRFWELLKEKKHIVFECDAIDVARLKKAIIKEKDMDIAFKLESAEAGNFWVLRTVGHRVDDDYRARLEMFLELRNDCVI